MLTCSHCAGFVPTSASSCPNCDRPLDSASGRAVDLRDSASGRAVDLRDSAARGAAKQLAKVGAAAATMVTLMACYGYAGPPIETPMGPTANDRDGDGFEAAPRGAAPSPAYDCDDTSKDVHPGADDPTGDSLDQNCDGMDGSATSPAAPTATMAVDPPPETKPQPPAVAK